jgi:pullulanase-type alpha-1,6-glucosidase
MKLPALFAPQRLTPSVQRPLMTLAIGFAASLLAACSGGGTTAVTPVVTTPPPAALTLRMHFHRVQNDAAAWGAYAFDGPKVPSAVWIKDRFLFTKSDSFGGYADIALDPAKQAVKFLVTDGDGNKNCSSDQAVTLAANIATAGQEVWMVEGSCVISDKQPAVTAANFNDAKAIWLSSNTMAWPAVPATGSYKMYYAANGGIGADANGITGADGNFSVTVDSNGLSAALQAKFPHLKNATALKLRDADAASAKTRLKGQVVMAQFDASGKLVQAGSVQTAAVMDDLYAASAASSTLGLSFDANNVASFRLWAPTAKTVKLNLYADASSATKTTLDMTEDTASGVWSVSAGSAAYTNVAYYTFTVNVFSRWAENKVISNEVTDPYSLSLNANSKRSFVANLDSAALKPAGWDQHAIPALAHQADISLYELHVRDFSQSDATVPDSHKGKFLAFTDTTSNGMQHLRRLQQAGLTHIHLLPSFDIATVNETTCVNPVIPNAAADSDAQQAAAVADTDCFNWGYDPYHYTAPEGSYATNANDGSVRVKEFRSMIKSLHESGLRVAMDVVYNHTTTAKQNDTSVLDKIVPGYYYRMSPSGDITTDSCCTDTAAENAMMAKLMIDSVKTWATAYQVDSFRFDLMSFAPLDVMNRLKSDVTAAAGRPIYIYGEAWNFGVIQNDARFKQARQANMFGNGIGSFNDRLRDAVRGGGCCDNGDNTISQQGFINGAFLDKNATSTQSQDDLLKLADLVRVGLSGTLRDYSFTDRTGAAKKSADIDYAGMAAGYNADPFETINYVEAHDNQTLFDINAYKLPAATAINDRVRVQNLGAAIVTLAQGVPFYHAGQEILRSKSLDSNSYNAGDWFNRLDYSYQSNNFGVGLPLASSNQANWALMRPILTNARIKPAMADILNTRDNFTDLLAIRKDSTLFRLRSGQDVKDRLTFYNVGASQVPGVIAMRIDGQNPSTYAGAKYKSVVVLFNADKAARTVTIAELKGKTLSIHPVQQASSADALAKTASYTAASGAFTIPARSTVVFVE